MRSRPKHLPIDLILLLAFLGGLMHGCGDGSRDRQGGPMSSYSVRRFPAPGQIAQSLDAGGRALIFLELASAEDGTPFDVDPAWTFELTIRGPSGASVPATSTPLVPSAWRSDPGVRVIGGFEAPQRGTYQIDVTSENCPPRKARMLVLPIN